MTFSSLTFLFLLFPITFLLYAVVRNSTARNLILAAASLVFYAWGEPIYVLLMLASIIVNYFAGLLLDKYRKQGKLILVLDLIFNLGLLGFFKYASFGSIVLVNYLHVPMTPLSRTTSASIVGLPLESRISLPVTWIILMILKLIS